jgi:hypothetical protein
MTDGKGNGSAGGQGGTMAASSTSEQTSRGAAQGDTDEPEPRIAGLEVTTLALLLGLLASVVVGLGFCFTIWELRRISGHETRGRRNKTRVASELDPELAA